MSDSPSASCFHSVIAAPAATTSRSPWSSRSRKGSNDKSRTGLTDDETTDDSMANKIGELWEECYDISEILSTLKRRVARNCKLWQESDEEKEDLKDQWIKFLEIQKNICDDLAKVSMDKIVFGLQRVFSKNSDPAQEADHDDEKSEDIPFRHYLEQTGKIRKLVSGVLDQSFHLFLQSCEVYL